MGRLASCALAACLVAASGAAAHEAHRAAGTSATGNEQVAPAEPAVAPFPFDIRPRFNLIDHTGTARTQADYDGRAMVVFFGYASCEAICSVALPRLAGALDRLGPKAADVAPLFITVDPANDTPAVMAKALGDLHPALIGLTGGDAALAAARAPFQIDAKPVATAPDGSPIFAHGSFVYIFDSGGRLAHILPPTVAPEYLATMIRRQLRRGDPAPMQTIASMRRGDCRPVSRRYILEARPWPIDFS